MAQFFQYGRDKRHFLLDWCMCAPVFASIALTVNDLGISGCTAEQTHSQVWKYQSWNINSRLKVYEEDG